MLIFRLHKLQLWQTLNTSFRKSYEQRKKISCFFLVLYPCAVLYAPLPPSLLTRSSSKLFAMCLSTIESLTEAMGVLRETWYRMKNDGARSKSILREHPFIQGPPGSRIVLPDFDAPIDLEDGYAQRLTAYLQVNVKYPYLKRSSFCSFKLFLFFCFFFWENEKLFIIR